MMKRLLLPVLLLFASNGWSATAQGQPEANKKGTDSPMMQPTAANPQVRMETSKGIIELELFADKAPKTVANFLQYVDDGFYDGTIFHRVIDRFMIQGGGFTPEMKKKETRPPIMNEADNGLGNVTGSIAMARTSDPHSATAQFYINVNDNASLNFRERTPHAWGYAVFGQVTKGIEVVMAIKKTPTTVSGHYRDVPAEQITITRVSRIQMGDPDKKEEKTQ